MKYQLIINQLKSNTRVFYSEVVYQSVMDNMFNRMCEAVEKDTLCRLTSDQGYDVVFSRSTLKRADITIVKVPE